MTPEGKIQKEIMDYLEAAGILHWKHHNTPLRRRKNICKVGVADIIAVLKPYGTVVAIEVKTPSGVMSEDQKRFLGQIDASGGISGVVTSLDDLQRLLGKNNACDYIKIS